MAQVFAGFGWILLYFIICVFAAALIRLFTRIPDEGFRKLLHCILLGSLWVWLVAFPKWWMAAATAIGFAALVFPVLCLAERIKGYSQFITERKSGELKASLWVVFVMFAAVVSVCWGIFGDRHLALASIYAWGFGDAAAALVGKRFGRHKFSVRIAKGKKSKEGSAVMFIVSFLCVLAILFHRGGSPWLFIVLTAAVTAAVSTAAELFTPNGLDTLTCPLLAMGTLLMFVYGVQGVLL